jgi:hypothetical protein
VKISTKLLNLPISEKASEDINEVAKCTQLLGGLEGLIGQLILKFPIKWDDWKSFVSIQRI